MTNIQGPLHFLFQFPLLILVAVVHFLQHVFDLVLVSK